ncbi:MAG: S46 family peptidase [Melioribacteraceae bacterium]|nr:S46 family peptidase [Melioribacteraceae bacterium]MCF8354218.1 S46 family peptidase [Melioribacteraceae bacterium]MCF8392864.1 S46 family peptidase [Melioribacteraceae bacterium]MCF8418650.1 S46 family peptidase [Melioribacteraceae bacterium]
MNSVLSLRYGLFFALLFFTTSLIFAQSNTNIDYDTVSAKRFDTGKMWTFDYPPVDYLKNAYGFEVTEQWLEDVRLSALRIPGCTASFVSEDGLIMTNHHCSEGHRNRVQLEGENLAETGFFAKTLEEERKVPRFYAEQLVLIEDVTDEIIGAMNSTENDEQRLEAKRSKISELEEKYSEETGLKCQVAEYYNGGKYSLQGFRRYEDVRLVFIPEEKIGYFGGDFDNFTYPRYNLDCTFFRVYENDKPIKSPNYFKWSENGAKLDELIFAVGNPGSTNRLKTVAQLEYNRDVSYRNIAFMLDEYYNALEELKTMYPDRADEFEAGKVRIGNAQKVYTNIYDGLTDPYLLARKKDFENKLKEAVHGDSKLDDKYGHVWDAIEDTREEMYEIGPKISAYNFNPFWSSEYFGIAGNVIKYADQMVLPEDQRDPEYVGAKLDTTKMLMFPENFDYPINYAKLAVQLDYIAMNLGYDNELVENLTNGLKHFEAAEYAINNSSITSKEKMMNLLEKSPEAILESGDPFINFMITAQNELPELQKQSEEIQQTEEVHEDLLGQAIFTVHGTTIPPDANRTLRLGDGVLKGFEYNGTVAPVITTFFGLYDRYYSNFGKYPWDLPERYMNYDDSFDLNTPFNFISTQDIVGGSSGSPVINTNAELVGLAFDGNIHSIIGNFIYMPENNRMVSVASQGMLEAIQDLYKAKRLAEELKTGMMAE